MLAVEQMVLEENEMLRNEGKRIGIIEGQQLGINRVAKEMLKNKMKDDDIIKYTHISKKELEKLKMQMV